MQEKAPYIEQPRAYGSGDLRIGLANLDFGEDIFSLAICANLKDEIINKYFDVIAGRIRDEPLEDQIKLDEDD